MCLPEFYLSQAGPLVVVDRDAGESPRAIIGRKECRLLGRPTSSAMGTDADQDGPSFQCSPNTGVSIRGLFLIKF